MYRKIGFCLTAIFLAGVGLSTLASDDGQTLATVRVTGERIDWSPQVENNGFTLVVSGKNVDLRREYRAGETLSFFPVDELGNPLPDGTYNWELRVIGPLNKSAGNGMNNGRPGDENREQIEPNPVTQVRSRALMQAGTITIANRAIVNPNLPEPQSVPSRSTQNSGKPGREGLNADGVEKDQQILDDLIVDGSACIGQDCVNGESFGFDTIRIKENNLRIRAVDTSNSASFPTRDWQLTFNDSSNGGANKFSIDDIDAGRTPFTIEGGSPSHSLYVDDGGRIGFGTSTPVVEMHVKDGDTPTLRLEQDGSSGFGQQTWDVAGNEAGFFVRDATNGSKLSFRIEPNSPSESIFIKTDRVHIKGPIEPWHVVVYKSSGLADTDDIDHVAESDFSMRVTSVTCTSDDATAVVTMERNGAPMAANCTCDGAPCGIDNAQDDFIAGDKLDLEVISAGTAKRISVHLKRSGT